MGCVSCREKGIEEEGMNAWTHGAGRDEKS